MLEVKMSETEVVVLVEPYGSATLNLMNNTVSFELDEVPWAVFVKVNKELKRAISRNNRQNMDFSDDD